MAQPWTMGGTFQGGGPRGMLGPRYGHASAQGGQATEVNDGTAVMVVQLRSHQQAASAGLVTGLKITLCSPGTVVQM